MKKNDPVAGDPLDAGMAQPAERRCDSADATVLPTGNETLDALFSGRLRILQSRTGYRFSLDALLLAHFASPRGAEKMVDLGCGSGVISLLLASFHPDLVATGIDIQETMVACARRSACLNGLDGRVQFLQCDVCTIAKTLPPAAADLIVCNPPYRGIDSGRISRDGERMIARHEIKAELPDFVHAGAYLLRSKGRMVLILQASRVADLLLSMRSADIEPKRLRFVHSSPNEEASLIIVEGVKRGRKEQKILPPLMVYDGCHNYTPEVAAVLSGELFRREPRSPAPISPAARKFR